ncbi:MAG: DNA polymerase III subunit delta' [Bacteroidota bacterium]|nr:DNA polymerase III subunit delta' [Bacteroidota bacterium]
MFFADIAGQTEVKERIQRMANEERIPHALLFLGNEGSGNLATAVTFAQYVFCTNKQNAEPCNQCASCQKVNKLAHPDLHFVYPIASSKDVRLSEHLIRDFREAFLANPLMNQQDWFNELSAENKQPTIAAEESNNIIKKLSYTSYEGGYKFMIIWQPEKMNASAANKLLKILEEPPDQTIFILVCHHAEQLLTTILSRTQLVKFGLASDDEIAELFHRKYGLSDQLARYCAGMAEGNQREALLIAKEQDSHVAQLAHFQNFMRGALNFNVFKINPWIEQTAALGREKQKYFLQYGLQLLRECLLLNSGGETLVKARNEELDFLKKFSAFVHMGNYERIVEEFNKAYYHIERNANPKILFMDMSLTMNELLNSKKPA